MNKKVVDLLITIKPRLIFLTGKSSTGKTTLSNKLKNEGYEIIELDLIVRSLGKKYNVGSSPDYDEAFKLYKGKVSKKMTNDFIKIVRKMINSKKDKPFVIEGAISDPSLIKKIFTKELSIFTFIYLNIKDHKKHRGRLMKRLVTDINENKKTLPFWSELPSDFSLNNKKHLSLITKISKKEKKKSNERMEMFLKTFKPLIIDV